MRSRRESRAAAGGGSLRSAIAPARNESGAVATTGSPFTTPAQVEELVSCSTNHPWMVLRRKNPEWYMPVESHKSVNPG